MLEQASEYSSMTNFEKNENVKDTQQEGFYTKISELLLDINNLLDKQDNTLNGLVGRLTGEYNDGKDVAEQSIKKDYTLDSIIINLSDIRCRLEANNSNIIDINRLF